MNLKCRLSSFQFLLFSASFSLSHCFCVTYHHHYQDIQFILHVFRPYNNSSTKHMCRKETRKRKIPVSRKKLKRRKKAISFSQQLKVCERKVWVCMDMPTCSPQPKQTAPLKATIYLIANVKQANNVCRHSFFLFIFFIYAFYSDSKKAILEYIPISLDI